MAAFRTSVQLESLAWATLAAIVAAWSSVLYSLEKSGNRASQLSDYRLIDEDFPVVHPLTIDTVFLAPEDTMHYQIYTPDGMRDWTSMFPPGGGWVQLGPQNRTFQLTLFHELWCLGVIRVAVATQSMGEDPLRLHRCFNYLRELILCRADVTLEDVLDAQHSVNHMFPHVCKDWEAVYGNLIETESD